MAPACRRDFSDADTATRRPRVLRGGARRRSTSPVFRSRIQQLTDTDMEDALKGMEGAAKQLANFDVEVIYQAGVPPVVARGPGFANELADRCRKPAACR